MQDNRDGNTLRLGVEAGQSLTVAPPVRRTSATPASPSYGGRLEPTINKSIN